MCRPRKLLLALSSTLLLIAASLSAHSADSGDIEAPPAPATNLVEVDLELILAVDVSRSMDADEQRLQRDGYVKAFRHPEVIRAITEGQHGRIAVTYVEWAGTEFHSVLAPWAIIAGRQDAEAFADKLAAAPYSRESATSISSALLFATGRLESSGARGDRRVIDISGDGANNMGMPVETTRDWVVRQGITINGLPIMLKVDEPGRFTIPNLDAYYAKCVIGGPGAFMITIDQPDRFEVATRRKLVLEVSGLPARVILAAAEARPQVDCLAGEKARGTQR